MLAVATRASQGLLARVDGYSDLMAHPATPSSGAPAAPDPPTTPLGGVGRWLRRRVSLRFLLTVVLPVVVLIIVLATIDVGEIADALRGSDWRWVLVGALVTACTYPGAGMAFAALSPVRLALLPASLVHAAGAFVSLAAPAGVGSAALNLRMLAKKGVPGPLGVATVALIQVMQLLVTVLMLLALSLLSGRNQTEALTPNRLALVVAAVVGVLVVASLLVPRWRRRVVRSVGTTVRQTWPRLREVIRQPSRIALSVLGSAIVTGGYVVAFDACLLAFDIRLGLVQLAVIYLVGNTAGAIVPSPGGVGTIEVTLIGGLTAAGVPAGVAASVVILFRLLTFWLPVPAGWAALHSLQRSGDI